MKNEHVKDAAQGGGVKALILSVSIFRRQGFFKAHDGCARLSPAPYLSASRQEPSRTRSFKLEAENLEPQDAQG